jgi:hypothetical protein
MLHSRQFSFLIGPNEEAIVVHAGAIAALSPPLERLVNGPMKEAQEGVARFPKLELCDFERVCEFAYRGNYTNPDPTMFDEANVYIKTDFYILSESIADRLSDKHLEYPMSLLFAKSCEEQYCESTYIWQRFGNASRNQDSSPWSPEEDGIASSKRSCWKQNVAPVLLGHARLYTFAQQYMIDELKDIALSKLRDYLFQLRVYSLTRGPIIGFLRYAYDNDNIMDREDDLCIDPLREIALYFIYIHDEAFKSFPGHQEAVRMEGEYAVDLMNCLRARLNAEKQGTDEVLYKRDSGDQEW